MLKHFVLLLALLQMSDVIADEATPAKSTSPDEIAKLIDRIDQLEKRIKELERQATKPHTVTVIPKYQPYSPPPSQPYLPNSNPPPANYQQAPGLPSPYVPPYQQPYPPNKTVPESWKPFNFNGMQYYIIPVDEAERMNRAQGNDRTNR